MSPLIKLALGAFLGFWVNPRSWPALHGPFRTVAIVLGTQAIESNGVEDAVKQESNGTVSRGLLMYNDVTADGDPLPATTDYEWRNCAFCSGFRYPQYIAAAVTHQPAWALVLSLPLPMSWAWFRWVHRHGYSSSSWAGAKVSEVYAEARAEDPNRSIPRSLLWMVGARLALLVPSILSIQLAAVALGVRLSTRR